jgi:EmrB/QacA subfamily drug resistance transporter
LAQLMIVLDVTIVTVALPTIQHALDISTANRQLVLTVYTLTFGGLLLLGGRISDYTGRKRAFIIGLIGFAAASALGGASVNSGMLLGARAIQGVFAALMAPTALSLLTNTFPDPAERGKAFAVFGAVAGGGSAVGLTLGGVLTSYLSWHWILYVNIPIAIVAVLGAMLTITEPGGHERARFDIAGAATVTAGLAALVYGFSEAVTNGWSASLTLGLIAGGVALLAVFAGIQWRTRHPLLPPRLVANRGRGAAYLTVLLATVGLFGAFFFLPFYLQLVLGYSAVKTGVALLPLTAAVIVTAAVVSRLMHRAQPRILMGTGLMIAAAGMAWLTQVSATSGYPGRVLPSLLALGVGLGLVFPVAANLATFQVAPRESGVASATLNVGQQVGGSLGTALLNAVAAGATADYLAAHHGRLAHAAGLVDGYTLAFAWGAVILVVAGLVAFLVTKARLDGSPSVTPETETDAPGTDTAIQPVAATPTRNGRERGLPRAFPSR